MSGRYFLIEATEISAGEVRVDAVELSDEGLIRPRDVQRLSDWHVGTGLSVPVAAAVALERVV
jgi:hypothetical protein